MVVRIANASGAAPHITDESLAYGQLVPTGAPVISVGYADVDGDIDASSAKLSLLKWSPTLGWSADLVAAYGVASETTITSTRLSTPFADLPA